MGIIGRKEERKKRRKEERKKRRKSPPSITPGYVCVRVIDEITQLKRQNAIKGRKCDTVNMS